MTATIPDITLNHWADRFIEGNVIEVMTFEEFMTLSVPLRERRLSQMALARHAQRHADHALPDAGVRDGRLIDPMHHGVQVNRLPFYFRRRHGTTGARHVR